MNKYKEKKIILICARGLQSTTVAAKIRPLGFQPLVLKGGLTSWQNADLPLIKNKG
jgi:rhodanese-related sulfurtransferase